MLKLFITSKNYQHISIHGIQIKLQHLQPFFLVQNVSKTFITSTSQMRFNSTTEDLNKPNYEMSNPYEKEKTKCILCQLNISPDYKNVKLLSQFQSSYTGRIYGKHITGLCSSKQKQVEQEILKAQSAGLMGYYTKDPDFLQDPHLFDSENPIRPHRF